MTRPEFIRTHEAKIRALALKLDVDMGVAAAVFCNACWWGHIPTGDEIAVQHALREVGDDAFFQSLHDTYRACVTEDAE